MPTKHRIPEEAKIKVDPPRPEKRIFRFSLRINTGNGWNVFIDDRIEAINKDLLDGKITLHKAKAEVERVKKSLYRERDAQKKAIAGQSDNEKLALAYYQKNYENPRKVVAANTKINAKNEFECLCSTIGDASIRSATQEELEKAIDKSDLSLSRKNAITTRLNSLLRSIGRDIAIQKIKESHKEVTYLSEGQLAQVLVSVLDPYWHSMFVTAYYTGLREGELFGLLEDDLDLERGLVHVRRQMMRDRSIDLPKNGKKRRTIILPPAIEAATRWVSYGPEIHSERRLTQPTEILKKACLVQEIMPVGIHALRHSFAIILLREGYSLSIIARLLGDTEQVAERHYAGFVLTEDTIEYLAERLKTYKPHL
ncbi:MAG: site-specific integrase [Oligoflexus sp.]